MCPVWSWVLSPVPEIPYLGSRRRAHSGVAAAEASAGTCRLSPHPKFKKGGRGRYSAWAGCSAHDYTLLKPEGFMRALAITTTICCAGKRQILFLFVSGSESWRSRFQHERLHNSWGRREKPCCWPELTSFFLNNSTCVRALGRSWGWGNEHHHVQ